MLRETDNDISSRSAAAEASAQSADLVYCSDVEPGISRRRAGKGFSYHDAGGRRIAKAETLARIRALAIPPAWDEVWIANSADCHIQATGRDQRGRKQYRYHARWTACRDEVKYGSLLAFGRSLPAMRRRVDADLSLRGLPRERVLATVVWLLDNLMIRVGNMGYAKENKSFGLTTLRDRHVKVSGSTLRFAFRGKSGKEWDLKVTDRRIARIVKGAQDIPGQHLFQYKDETGERRAIASQDVNAYLREIGGQGFTSKHFRTWGGTVAMAKELAGTPVPETKRETAMVLNAAIDIAAHRLGNTRTVCRNCYIHPLVIETWLAGKLGAEMVETAGKVRRAPKWMDRDEAILLRWLEGRAA